MAKDIEHLLMYLFAICTSSLENCLSNAFAHLLIQLFSTEISIDKNIVAEGDSKMAARGRKQKATLL
jgi:hypothetical protein